MTKSDDRKAGRPNDEEDDESSPLLARPSAGFDSISTTTTKKSKKNNGDDETPADTLPDAKEEEINPAPAPAPDATPTPPAAAPAPDPDPAAATPAPAPAPAPGPAPDTKPPPPPARTPSPQHVAAIKADQEIVWSEPAGLRVRGQNDENLIIFRRAVGINSGLSSASDCRSLEEGRKQATGMYAACIQEQRQKKLTYMLIREFFSLFLVSSCHFLASVPVSSV